MQITITQKFRPFSHRVGIRCFIPFTHWEVQVFPTRLFFRSHKNNEEKEIKLSLDGPCKGFTVMQDLEKGKVILMGRIDKGYFRHPIDEESYPFLKKYSLPFSQKRLFMGVHKKQDWDLIVRRKDMAEIFPFWMKLSTMVPQIPLPKKPIGTMALLNKESLNRFFETAFQGMFCPRLQDENYLGIIPDVIPSSEDSALGLIHAGAKVIESLFFAESEDTWTFLPYLPKEFHAGKFVHLQTELGDEIDLQWSKKTLQAVCIRPAKTRAMTLKLQKGIKSFRVRAHKKDRGYRTLNQLALEQGKPIYLDRFMK